MYNFSNPFDRLWAAFWVLELPLGSCWVPFGTLLGYLGTEMEVLGVILAFWDIFAWYESVKKVMVSTIWHDEREAPV